jgi:hypothetical protein
MSSIVVSLESITLLLMLSNCKHVISNRLASEDDQEEVHIEAEEGPWGPDVDMTGH